MTEVLWSPIGYFYSTRGSNEIETIYTKGSWQSPILQTNIWDSNRCFRDVCGSETAFVGGIGLDKRLYIYAKPGIEKETYIYFFGSALFSIEKEGDAGELCIRVVELSSLCMQHSLSLINKHVLPTLKTLEYEHKIEAEEITIDDFWASV